VKRPTSRRLTYAAGDAQRSADTVLAVAPTPLTDPYVVELKTTNQVRVALISDTHLPECRADLWPEAYEFMTGADVVLHGGDIHDVGYLDHLSAIAPTFAARGNGEEGSGGRVVQPADARLRSAWLLDIAGLIVGLIHYPLHEEQRLDAELQRVFGRSDIDVIVYGHTHVEAIDVVGSVLCVNPGSPTWPHNRTNARGTIGELAIADGVVTASVHQLVEGASEPFDWGTRHSGAHSIEWASSP
jgi:uncharacterized protein